MPLLVLDSWNLFTWIWVTAVEVFLCFHKQPTLQLTDACSRCSLVHCGLQALCPLEPNPGSHWYQWQSFHWFWRFWIVPFMAFNVKSAKGSCINTAFFTLWGFIFYLFLYWAEIVLENATRPSNCCQQIPCTRGSFSCFALWHQYTCCPNYEVSWIEKNFVALK